MIFLDIKSGVSQRSRQYDSQLTYNKTIMNKIKIFDLKTEIFCGSSASYPAFRPRRGRTLNGPILLAIFDDLFLFFFTPGD